PHIRQRRGGRAVDIRPARGQLVPVDAGRDRDAGADTAGQGDAGLERAAVIEDVRPLAVAQAAGLGIESYQLDGGLASGGAVLGAVGERRVQELRSWRAE